MKRMLCLAALVALAGCPKKEEATKEVDAGAVVATDAAAGPADAGAAEPASTKATWSGPYTLAPGTLSIPTGNKDYAGVKQFKDDPSKHMGDGKIELTVDGEKVAGTIEGAAGPAIIEGSVVDGEIRGVVRRKDPKDDGLTGTIAAKIAGASAEGTLNLADGTTAIVREAKITLTKK
ncbi:MAG: hypothetical protein KIT84_05290 [Labilithrix sp.]|nr:hypothetical protein [Labilithrix sp.]MCW5810401.1 hypothetical protein [Labilithrix sp.]